MKTYQVMMSDLVADKVIANNAADAIQTALMRHPNKTVVQCSCPGMSYDIPKHKALTEDDIASLKPKREPRQNQQCCSTDVNKPAPWIEEWMARKK